MVKINNRCMSEVVVVGLIQQVRKDNGRYILLPLFKCMSQQKNKYANFVFILKQAELILSEIVRAAEAPVESTSRVHRLQ